MRSVGEKEDKLAANNPDKFENVLRETRDPFVYPREN